MEEIEMKRKWEAFAFKIIQEVERAKKKRP
jgi:hypothetical protein